MGNAERRPRRRQFGLSRGAVAEIHFFRRRSQITRQQHAKPRAADGETIPIPLEMKSAGTFELIVVEQASQLRHGIRRAVERNSPDMDLLGGPSQR